MFNSVPNHIRQKFFNKKRLKDIDNNEFRILKNHITKFCQGSITVWNKDTRSIVESICQCNDPQILKELYDALRIKGFDAFR